MNTLNSSSSPAGWRIARRLLVGLAAAATLLTIFYTVENWRGRRAWENCRRALEAKGEVLDWAAYIPAPVPDDQNFYEAPHMQEWFVRGSSATLGSPPANWSQPFVPAPRKDTNLILAEVKVVSNVPLDSHQADAVLRLDDAAAREQAAKLLRAAIGPCAIGAKNCVLVARPLEQCQPLHLVLEADTAPTTAELASFFPRNPPTVPNSVSAFSALAYVQVERAESNTFRVSIKAPVYGAADYLAWTKPLTSDFALVHNALQRPYSRINCDYQTPFAIAVPNFFTIRNLAQTLSQRTQSYLLLNQPELAWQDLALVHDLCQILQAKPSGKPLTLVGAMIHVAVAGLHAGIVEDGLRLHAWRDPQLLAIEQQLQQTDLLPSVVEALKEERAATWQTIGSTKRAELIKLLNFGDSKSKLQLDWMPRGWFYQNMAIGARVEQELLTSIDPTNQLVWPHLADKYYHQLEARLKRHSPYTLLVAIATPNFLRAVQTVARNQTQVNQARLACALERYHLAQAQYPETLDALTPRFIDKLPHDLIGGQPLIYRRTDGGGYLLYSIGWDEIDNGGVPGKTTEEGDWVWELRCCGGE